MGTWWNFPDDEDANYSLSIDALREALFPGSLEEKDLSSIGDSTVDIEPSNRSGDEPKG